MVNSEFIRAASLAAQEYDWWLRPEEDHIKVFWDDAWVNEVRLVNGSAVDDLNGRLANKINVHLHAVSDRDLTIPSDLKSGYR
jgi:hypothetical protein